MFGFEILGYVGLVVFIGAGVFAAEMDSAIMAGATFIIGLITLEYGFGFGLWPMIVGNPLWIIGFVILYVAAGALYTALWRWPEYIRKNESDIMDNFTRWANGRKDTQNNSFDAFLDSEKYYYNASQHKERLGTWVGMWPFSFFWEVLRKPAIWIWKISYASLSSLFESIGRRTARKLHDGK